MCATSTKIAGERLPDLLVRWLWVFFEERSGRHNHSVGTVPALPRLLGDKGFLDWVRIGPIAEAFEGSDSFVGHGRYGRDAGTNGYSVN